VTAFSRRPRRPDDLFAKRRWRAPAHQLRLVEVLGGGVPDRVWDLIGPVGGACQRLGQGRRSSLGFAEAVATPVDDRLGAYVCAQWKSGKNSVVWRELLLGLLGLQGDGRIPERGWLRWAMIGFYAALAIVIGSLLLGFALS
jgi:hypothetical protein